MQARVFAEEVSSTILEIIYNKVVFLLERKSPISSVDETGRRRS